jgi:hypothetical protein
MLCRRRGNTHMGFEEEEQESTCPVQYHIEAGDVPGWGSISGLHSINSVSSCAEHCDLTYGCCSFEYSLTERRCNLNRECKPTTTVYKDYAYCVKGSTCPVQYTNYAGDVPGWGSIRSLLSINNVASCANHCDLTSGCCSFEYSPTERRCNLNTECKPTTAAVHKDYTFCVKGIKTRL